MTDPLLSPSWQGLEQRYGPFPRQHHVLAVGPDFPQSMAWNTQRRNGEVVLVLRRPDGRVLLHTKPFYPPDTWRLPTGGVKQGETPEEAAQREMAEETGLPGRLEQLLGVLTYDVDTGGTRARFASAVFLVTTPDAPPALQDPGERITGYRWVLPAELVQVAAQLRRLPSTWSDWGRYRALAHLFVAECLSGWGGPRRLCRRCAHPAHR